MKISVGIDAWLLILGLVLSKNIAVGLVCIICAGVHEIGHLCAAKYMKIKIKEMKLGFAGAKIYPESNLISYKQEFFLCVFGPVFNIISAFLSLSVLFFIISNNPSAAENIPQELTRAFEGESVGIIPVLLLVTVVSLMQAMVNLLPIEGLDGGRMLKCVLSRLGSANTAEKAEKAVTVFTTITLWIFSVYLLLKTGSGLGIFVFALCGFSKVMIKKHNYPQ